MMNFKKIALEEVCSIQIGKTPRREVGKYWGKGYGWVSISDMKSKVITQTKEEITEVAVKECGCKLILKGTLLLSFKLSIGKLAFAGKNLFTNEAIVGLQIKDTNLLDSDYIFYVLKNIPLIGSNNAAMGSTLNKESLRALKLPIPERISDQRHIANILSKAEALIAQRKQSIALLDALLKSAFLEMFGDPVRNEKGWDISNVGDQCKVKGGKRIPKGAKLIKENTGYPYIKAGNIKKGKITLEDIEYLPLEIKEKLKRYTVEKGDVCITVVGVNIGDIGIVPQQLHLANLTENANKILIKEKNKLSNVYLAYYLMMDFVQSKLVSRIRASGVPKLALFRIEQIDLLMPPLELQNRFTHIVEKIELLKTNYEQSLQELENLYGSLSQRAFKGELLAPSATTVIPLPNLDKLEEKHFLKRKVLATYIINQSLDDSRFGDVKFEKLLHLSDYFAIKRNLNQNYIQKAAGPYDNKFTIPFFDQVTRDKWFIRTKQGSQYVFKKGAKHDGSTKTYNLFSDEELQQINKLIGYFKKYDYEQPEIVSTLYAVWNNRIIKDQTITDELLKEDFLNWDIKKAKYKDRLDVALKWMRKEGIVPDGWGKAIEKPKTK